MYLEIKKAKYTRAKGRKPKSTDQPIVTILLFIANIINNSEKEIGVILNGRLNKDKSDLDISTK